MESLQLEPTIEEELVSASFIPETPKPSQLDLLAASARQESLLGSAVERFRNRAPDVPAVPNYNPFAELDDKYMNEWDRFSQSNSPEQTGSIMAQLDQEERDWQAREAGGWSSYAYDLAFGVTDPVNLALSLSPMGWAQKGTSVGRTALEFSISTAVGATVTEAGLQASQYSRPWQMSATAIGGSALLGGIFGGIGQGIANKQIRKMSKDLDDYLENIATNDGLDPLPKGDAGAARSIGTLAEESPVGVVGPRVNPLTDMLGETDSPTLQNTISRLVTHNWDLGKNKVQVVADDGTPILGKDGKPLYKHTGQQAADLEIQEMSRGLVVQQNIIWKTHYKSYLKEPNANMSKKEFREALGKALNTGDVSDIVQVQKAAKEIRKILNRVGLRMQEAGMLPDGLKILDDVEVVPTTKGKTGANEQAILQKIRARGMAEPKADMPARQSAKLMGAQSYFPYIYNWKVIEQNIVSFEDMLRRNYNRAGIDSAEIEEAVQGTIGNVRNSPDGRWTSYVVPASGHQKARTLDLPYSELMPYLKTDVEEVMNAYLKSVSPRLVLTEQFGSFTLNGEFAMINSEFIAAQSKAKTAGAKKRINKNYQRQRENLQHTLNQMLGNVAQPATDIGAKTATAARWIRGWNYMTTLGGMSLSSLNEIAQVVMNEGMMSAARAIPPTFSRQLAASAAEIGSAAGTQKQYWNAIGIATESVVGARALKIGEIDDAADLMGIASEKFTTLTGIKALTDHLQFAEAFAFNDRVVRIFDRLPKLKRGASTDVKIRTELARDGIDDEWIGPIADQIAKHKTKIKTAWNANTEVWTDRQAAAVFDRAVQKRTRVTVVEPGPGEIPIALTTEMGKMAGQFRSFLFASYTKLLMPTVSRISRADSRLLQGLFVYQTMGMFQHTIKMGISGRSDELKEYKPADWIKSGVEEAGLVSLPMELYNIADRFSAGWYGSSLSGMMGLREGRRHYDRSLVESLFGPSARTLESAKNLAFNITSPNSDFSKRDLHSIRKLIPGQNLFYTRWLLDQLETGTGEALDLPGKSRRSRPKKKRSSASFGTSGKAAPKF